MKSKTYRRKQSRRKSKKRGGHPVLINSLNPGRLTKCHRTDCGPQTLFKLNYLNKEAAEHLNDLADGSSTNSEVILTILDKRYGGEHRLFDGSNDEAIRERIKPGYCTIGIYKGSDKDDLGHGFIICNIDDDLYAIDPQTSSDRIPLDDFLDFETRNRLWFADNLSSSRPANKNNPVSANEVDEIISFVKEF